MIRAISITSAALLLALGSVAYANPKTVAVLGLEVTGADVTPQATDAASELTKELRNRVSSSSSYTMVGGGKELTDQKMIYSCQDEAPNCMQKMAKDLGASVLVYGSLQRKAKGYSVTLKLFDAGDPPHLVKQTNEQVSPGDLNGQGIGGAAVAKKLFAQLSGQGSNVQLTLRIQGSDSGTVRVNDAPAQPYTSGSVTVTVPEGRVHVVVEPNESQKLQRWDNTVQASGEEMSKDIQLVPVGGDNAQPCTTPGCTDNTHTYEGTTSDANGAGWRTGFKLSVVGFGLSAVSLGVSAYFQNANGTLWHTGNNCTGDTPMPGTSASSTSCSHGALFANMGTAGWTGVAVFGILGAIAYYEGYSQHTETKEHAENGHRKRRERFVVTPVVGQDGAGATVRLDW